MIVDLAEQVAWTMGLIQIMVNSKTQIQNVGGLNIALQFPVYCGRPRRQPGSVPYGIIAIYQRTDHRFEELHL